MAITNSGYCPLPGTGDWFREMRQPLLVALIQASNNQI